MKNYYVYILECSDGSYYTGVTNDFERRFWEHENGVAYTAYTYNRRPLKLVYSEVFDDALDAIGREKQIKRWNRTKKLALIKQHWNTLSQVAHRRCQCEHCIRTFRPCTKNHFDS